MRSVQWTCFDHKIPAESCLYCQPSTSSHISFTVCLEIPVDSNITVWMEVIGNGFVERCACPNSLLTTPSPGAWDSCGPEPFASMSLIVKQISTKMLRKYSLERTLETRHMEKRASWLRWWEGVHISQSQDAPMGTNLAEKKLLSVLASSLMGTKFLLE